MRRTLALLAAAMVSACAGLPVGHHTYIFAGVGVVRIQREARATAISSRSLGIVVGCQLAIVGAQQSYCAHIPADGDLAIFERAAGPDQHLKLQSLRPQEKIP